MDSYLKVGITPMDSEWGLRKEPHTNRKSLPIDYFLISKELEMHMATFSATNRFARLDLLSLGQSI